MIQMTMMMMTTRMSRDVGVLRHVKLQKLVKLVTLVKTIISLNLVKLASQEILVSI